MTSTKNRVWCIGMAADFVFTHTWEMGQRIKKIMHTFENYLDLVFMFLFIVMLMDSLFMLLHILLHDIVRFIGHDLDAFHIWKHCHCILWNSNLWYFIGSSFKSSNLPKQGFGKGLHGIEWIWSHLQGQSFANKQLYLFTYVILFGMSGNNCLYSVC